MVNLASRNYCPNCGSKISEKERHITHIVEGVIRTSTDGCRLSQRVNRVMEETKLDILKHPEQDQTVPTRDFRHAVGAVAVRGQSIDVYTGEEFRVLSGSAMSKLQSFSEEARESGLLIDGSSEDEDISLDSSTEDQSENNKPKPIVQTKTMNHIQIGTVDFKIIGTAHHAPILDSVYLELEEFDPSLILIESGEGNQLINSDPSGAVGHRAADKYESMNPSTNIELLFGYPEGLRSGVQNGYKTYISEEKLVGSSDPALFQKENELRKREYEAYERRIIENRNDKFALELFDHIEEYGSKDVAIICGKSHTPYLIDILDSC